jgi:pimeloyl-ACP methyl ester carboxylesterase
MGSLRQKVVDLDGFRLSYWENNPINTKQTVVILGAGAATGDFIEHFIGDFPNYIHIISPDYPGRGKTDTMDNFSFAVYADYILRLLEKLKLTNVIIIGLSFGSAIVNELVKKSYRFQKVIVIAGGEFFNPYIRVLLKILFFPAKFSAKLRRTYMIMLTKQYKSLKYLYHEDLSSILSQWYATLNYKLPPNTKVDMNATLIHFKEDTVIWKPSRKKLEKLYMNNNTIYVSLPHTVNMDKLGNLVQTVLLPIILESIKIK